MSGSTPSGKRSSGPAAADTPLSHGVPGRVIAFVVVVVLVVAGVIGYLMRARSTQQSAIRSAPALAEVDLAQVQSEPRIVFRSNSRAHYGVIAMVSLRDPSGPRALTSTPCERVYSAEHVLLCLFLDRTTVAYKGQLLDDDLHPVRSVPLAGVPSRARLSADGTLAATTTFTGGDSYASTSFSTRTIISRVEGDERSLSLEDFTLIHHSQKISPVDRNYWGVTFAADDNLFYATVAFGGHTWLVGGDLATRTVTTMHEDAECPSLSPDGTRVVYKKRLGHALGTWRLAVLNLATGTETMLAETRSIDDQVEWLDDNHVLYGVPGSGGDTLIDDVYSVAADGTGAPRLLISEASSPAVVR